MPSTIAKPARSDNIFDCIFATVFASDQVFCGTSESPRLTLRHPEFLGKLPWAVAKPHRCGAVIAAAFLTIECG